MAESAVAAVLSKFGELAASEAKILLEVGDNMMLLRDRLEWLQAFIRDADRKRRTGTDGLTRVWVRQTRDVAFEAEDALDEFFYEVELKRHGYHGLKMWRKYLTGFWNQVIIRHVFSARITRINRRLKKISENQKEYKIEHTPLATLTSSTTATSAWWDGYENAVGFQDDVRALQQMLLQRDHPQQMFISIFGDSGVGKRTVVHNIYHNRKVTDHFKIRVSYRMTEDSTTEDLLKRIYDEAHKGRQQPQHDNGMIIGDKLRFLLAERRYLVVISGLSCKTMLNRVRASLPDDNNGSRVVLILDIESEEVAWHANTMNNQGINGVHQLSRLDEKRSGQLFYSRAFRKEQSGRKEDMSKYNKIVYDITGGYPLAIVVLAGLLRFREKPGQWEAVLQQLRLGPGMEEEQDGVGNKIIQAVLSKEKSMEWQMRPAVRANMSTKRTIERVFWASFEDLPNDLKSCFLYLAAYPKNVIMHANITVFMWIAEGFIKPQKGKIMEEIGHNYIKELVLRCLVQVEEMDAAESITKISVHKSLHGFLHSEAHEAGFIEVHDIHDAFVPPSVRRLSYQSLEGRFTIFTNKFHKLHSFICYVEYRSIYSTGLSKKYCHDLKFLRWSKFLRLISVRGLRLDRLPDEIGDMVHLRYLRVECRNLKKLPSSIRRLLNLQTLDIRNTQVEKIDPCFWQIKVLRHVLADNLMLPETIKEELDELQTLHGVKPAEEGGWDPLNCPLHKMTRLRSLDLHGFKRSEHKAALESALTRMHLLGNLKLQGDKIPSCVFTGQHLQNLQIVVLDGTVKWPEAGWDVCKVRPNLVELTVVKHSSEDVPQHIKDELRDMLKETIAI
ncbi:hypothetical protein ACQJBY_025426 [Aegilops geniculata]